MAGGLDVARCWGIVYPSSPEGLGSSLPCRTPVRHGVFCISSPARVGTIGTQGLGPRHLETMFGLELFWDRVLCYLFFCIYSPARFGTIGTQGLGPRHLETMFGVDLFWDRVFCYLFLYI